MTLTTHAIVGAAMASLVPGQPVLGFALGFASHFAIDSIPHWAEGTLLLRSVVYDPEHELETDMQLGKNFIYDLAVLAADSLLGVFGALLILFYFFHVPFLIVLMGAVAGQLPDALQFVYFKTRWAFMTPMQIFHGAIQEEHESLLYLLREVGLIGAVVVMGLLGG